jgi:hypothetical protein
MLVRLSIPPS